MAVLQRQTNVVAITGNTFPVKDQLRALGGRWNADRKAWMVPAEKADQARQLVAGRRESVESRYQRKHGWDGVRGSSSYYTSGMYDAES